MFAVARKRTQLKPLLVGITSFFSYLEAEQQARSSGVSVHLFIANR
ncbi:hypothetical protein APHMUC_1146 [Anaplasma phagocytophilum str. ApMUC09]|uniref:Uncharacterized protein n=1 Tax=Anaplasma phagocytophilum str. ApMUC09 TaxID=1359152 RepID=A0A0F3N9Z1_ANAPH|nr:hypothetical protein APHMUC_1146 [Anaplasma phagocytophilum str. ApMUC09]